MECTRAAFLARSCCSTSAAAEPALQAASRLKLCAKWASGALAAGGGWKGRALRDSGANIKQLNHSNTAGSVWRIRIVWITNWLALKCCSSLFSFFVLKQNKWYVPWLLPRKSYCNVKVSLLTRTFKGNLYLERLAYFWLIASALDLPGFIWFVSLKVLWTGLCCDPQPDSGKFSGFKCAMFLLKAG